MNPGGSLAEHAEHLDAEHLDKDVTPFQENVLVTGFPAFSARSLLEKILSTDKDARVHILATRDQHEDARAFVAGLPAAHQDRTNILVGAVQSMDLGLSGAEYLELASELTTIYHLAGIADTIADQPVARAVNIEGTRNIIELSGNARRLRRLCHFSTAAVSGKRKGVILETELDCGQSFHNIYERTRFEAEKLARQAQRRIPVSIFRLGIVVGHSKTGEIDRFDGPYYWMVLIANNQMSVPLPGRGIAPLHLVPVDFVMDATHALSMDERAAGRTFHITDPNPLSAKRIFERVAQCCHARPPRGYIPGGVARALMKIPGLERMSRGPRFFLDALDHDVHYDCSHTLELLDDTGIECPPFNTYVENLVHYVQTHARTRDQAAPIEDELDPMD